MRKIVLSLLAAGTVLATAAPALARDGCGPGFHRAYRGHCVPNRGFGYNRGPVYVERGPRYIERGPAYINRGPRVRLVIGNFYDGRGYWDGRRYYQHRYRYNDGWRYR